MHVTLSMVIGAAATAGFFIVPVQTALWVMSLFGIVATLVLLTCGIVCAFRAVPGARIFVLAWTMLLIGTSLLALRNVGVLPSNMITVYSIQIGSALEMLLSLGLAARFNELKRQNEQAQQSALENLRIQESRLERMVEERTRELAKANAQLSQQALCDPLTGLFNRSGLAQNLDAAIQRAARHNHALAVMMIDLDGFNPINDIHGHDAGDKVLIQVAERLRECARGGDLIARFGGDEFILVGENVADELDAAALAERVLAQINQPITIDPQTQVEISASIGVTCSDPQKDHTADQLLKQADLAMYQRKHSGKSGISVSGNGHDA